MKKYMWLTLVGLILVNGLFTISVQSEDLIEDPEVSTVSSHDPAEDEELYITNTETSDSSEMKNEDSQVSEVSDMQQVQAENTSHYKIWIVAVITAIVVVGIGYRVIKK